MRPWKRSGYSNVANMGNALRAGRVLKLSGQRFRNLLTTTTRSSFKRWPAGIFSSCSTASAASCVGVRRCIESTCAMLERAETAELARGKGSPWSIEEGSTLDSYDQCSSQHPGSLSVCALDAFLVWGNHAAHQRSSPVQCSGHAVAPGHRLSARTSPKWREFPSGGTFFLWNMTPVKKFATSSITE